MGKWVRDEFKEIHRGAWKGANPSKNDILEAFVKVYQNTNRWEKSIQHLRDAGKLEGAPQDIGNIMQEFQKDLLEECGAEIKEKLFGTCLAQNRKGSISWNSRIFINLN